MVTSIGGDPYASFRLPGPIRDPAISLEFEMASESRGDGQLFWLQQGTRNAFSAKQRGSFAVQHDQQTHRYRVAIPATAALTSIRVDPSRGEGTMRIEKLRLIGSEGQTLYRW